LEASQKGFVTDRKNWLGYQGQDVEILVDLRQSKSINYLALNCLQDRQSWIFFPKKVSFYGSSNAKDYTLIATSSVDKNLSELDIQAFNYNVKLDSKKDYRYIKVIVENAGVLPNWHPGAGGESFIFLDELEID